MKNFFDSLKIFVVGLIFSSMMIFSANCSAADYSRSITELAPMIGNWYDSKGNLTLKIGTDYSINGCKVLSLNIYARNVENIIAFSDSILVAKINEGGHYRDIYLDYPGNENPNILIIDGKFGLHRNNNISHFESVGGIYLGMWKDEVLKLYGQPSKIQNNYGCVTTWNYNKDGFDLVFAADVVTEIKIYKNGTRKFDWSGLSANNSKSDFEYKYNGSFSRFGDLNIGHGEVINFYNRKNVSVNLKMLYSVWAR